MLVRIKPLKGAKPFSLECDADVSVGELKARISEKLGDAFPVDSQKIVVKGKVLTDGDLLRKQGFNAAKDFVVVAITRKKPVRKQAKMEVEEKPAEKPATTAPAKTTTQPAPVQNAAPAVSEAAIQQVVAMGFAENDAKAVLEVADGNVNAAIEFLMEPALLEAARRRKAQIQQQREALANQNPLERFRNSPGFAQIRQLVQNDPAAIARILPEIEKSNPQLFAYLNEDASRLEQLVDMLEGDDGDAPATESANPFGDNAPAQAPAQTAPGIDGAGLGAGLGALSGLGPGGAPDMNQMMEFIEQMRRLSPEERQALLQGFGLPPNALEGVLQMMQQAGMDGGAAGGATGQGQAPAPRARLELTAAEEADVANLMQLGFTRVQCVQAYLACDKNMEHAANLLFTNPPDDPNLNADAPPPPPNNSSGNGGAGAGDI